MEKILELKMNEQLNKVNPLDNRDQTIEQCKESLEHTISKEKILKLNSLLSTDQEIFSLGNTQITCVEFAPHVFAYLRQLDGVNERDIITSFLPSNNQTGIRQSEARGGNFFISTDNKEFLLKTIPYQDAELIRLVLLWHMAEHFTENKNSLIGRIYGLYKIEKKSSCFHREDIYFILMKNVYGAFEENVQCKYDLKGSSLDRKVDIQNMESINMKVMKDNNFREIEKALMLSNKNAEVLKTICEKDVVFLANLGVMDYSLLVVKIALNKSEMITLFGENHIQNTQRDIAMMLNNKEEDHQEEKIGDNKIDELRFNVESVDNLRKYLFPSLKYDQAYLIAIIDFFQLYNLQKVIEKTLKGMLADYNAISSTPPDDYVVRFLENLSEICDCRKFLEGNKKEDVMIDGFVCVG